MPSKRMTSRMLLSTTSGVWALVIAAGLGVMIPSASSADRYATSQRPHWEVGNIDAGLSNACRRLRFNQIADHRLHISYRGEIGAGVTGVAKKGWNLRDPDGRAETGATYHFADDGLSTCRVYVVRETTRGN
jgi:hypothetical protein